MHPSINRLLVEAVISPQSSLIGRTISNINFEEKFNAAVLAVSRGGRSFHQKISTIGTHLILYHSFPPHTKSHENNIHRIS